ncbi:hypothetical protein TNCV_517872 [Trichonephila clavipes]|nr:hypothetical protein TNCV_517872 [Trichonephila clavipes]
MRTRGDRDEYPIAPYTTTKFMGQYDDDECNLPMRIHQDVTKHGAASRVAAAMVSELRVHDVVNVVELFAQTLFVLKTTPILDLAARSIKTMRETSLSSRLLVMEGR